MPSSLLPSLSSPHPRRPPPTALTTPPSPMLTGLPSNSLSGSPVLSRTVFSPFPPLMVPQSSSCPSRFRQFRKQGKFQDSVGLRLPHTKKLWFLCLICCRDSNCLPLETRFQYDPQVGPGIDTGQLVTAWNPVVRELGPDIPTHTARWRQDTTVRGRGLGRRFYPQMGRALQERRPDRVLS